MYQRQYKELNAGYVDRREVALRIMKALGCEVSPGQQGLFLWGRIPDDVESGEKLADDLLYGAKVFLTPGIIFGTQGDRYIRLSLCATRETMEKALQRIENFKKS